MGADHAGFLLKEYLLLYLEKKGYDVKDLGAYAFNKSDDYPDFASAVGKAVSKHKNSFGILVCGSAQGICIAANKIRGIRAVAVESVKDAAITRTHNNANVLCLSGWHLPEEKAVQIAQTFLTTRFSNASRHKRRLRKIAKLER